MSDFLEEVVEGLSANDKYLLSKYFYDDAGDLLFQQIMALDEYYLTRAEGEIFRNQAKAICDELPKDKFRMAELGAGDGTKTRFLLQTALKENLDFSYFPIDISPHVLEILQRNLKNWLPDLKTEGIAAEYFKALNKLSNLGDQPLVVLFLGSNIGNFRRDNVDVFMSKLSQSLRKGDLLLLGVDLKKDPNKILAAYNDSKGITAAFNFNLLKRINRELGGDFNLNKFRHYNTYDPHTGECRSYLISLEKQDVHIGAVNRSFFLDAHEAIHTETSRKYSGQELRDLAARHQFKIRTEFQDEQGLFRDQIWEKL